ncbi:PRA1 family protein B4-like [Benincasa hispida]|uniref:PRA1 family protein B4-like n=1 Tax=Benincasa hispida TaxID=102211 RepID=UPI001900C1C2|nr:PRA1 family protein B4-like [Benincasa hispida]
MSSSSPAILPISNPQSTAVPAAASGGSLQSQGPVTTPAFRAFINHLSEYLRHGLSQRRSWAELADRTAFSKPESFSEATLRIRKNYSYFRVNYLAVIALILGFSLVSHPFSLILLAGLLSSWLFLYLFRPSDQPLVLFGRTFKDSETLILLVVLSVFVVFLTSVGSVLVSALMVGVALVCAHGAFRVPEDLFLDEQENVSTGFLSFFSSAASTAAAAAAPVAVRT